FRFHIWCAAYAGRRPFSPAHSPARPEVLLEASRVSFSAVGRLKLQVAQSLEFIHLERRQAKNTSALQLVWPMLRPRLTPCRPVRSAVRQPLRGWQPPL